MSGEYVELLKRRARSFLAEAETAVDPDLGVFFAEQAAQLYVKAVYYELFGERVRGHRLRELLGLPARKLEEHGYEREAGLIAEFTSENRRVLIMLEDAYTTKRVREVGYNTSDVKRALPVVRRLIRVLEEVARSVKLG